MRRIAPLVLLLLAGCPSLGHVEVNTTPGLELGMFVTGDLKNGEAIATAAHLDMVAACWGALEPVAMKTPDPTKDGAFTLLTRYMALDAATQNPTCAPILLKGLLKVIDKFIPKLL